MGKYDAVLDQLKPLPVEDAGWQAQVDAEKRRIQDDWRTNVGVDINSAGMAALYSVARAEKEVIALQLSAANVKIAALEQLLMESQDQGADGWGKYGVADNALRMEDGTTIRVQAEPYGKVVDKEAYRLWCIANGYETQLQLWPSRTNAIIKERLLHGEAEPDGTEAYSYKKIVFTSAKEK
jgi:ABC-type transporter Mla MlaB component